MARKRRTLPAVGEGKRSAEGHIAYLLRQAHAAVRLALNSALSDAGLTTPQFLVLNLLDAYPGASGADLARLAQLAPQTINLIVRKLERDGLIGRREHEFHGRMLRLDLTEQGKLRLARCKELADGVERRLLDLLDRDSQVVVRRWLAAAAAEMARS